MLNISIILPVFNGLRYTKQCLESLFDRHRIEQLEANIYIIIVDDGSTDGSFEWINENYSQVKLLKGNGNLWWSGGVNLAVEYAVNQLNTDYILWWNNDIVASAKYFENLIAVLNQNDENTIVGSKINLAQKKDIVWSMGGLFNPYSGKKSMIGSEKKDGDEYDKIVECDWLPGMGTITHKTVYEKIGMLDEKNFPQYHGDSDFTFRAKTNGFKIIVHPNLKIYNDTRHSGLKHDESFRRLAQSLFSIKSNFNIKRDFIFYRKHSKSMKAYLVVVNKYFKYIGGFIKWKALGLFGSKRK